MKVLFASSEVAPFAKTGGLGDVAGSLPAVLREKGVDARVIMPLYACIPQRFKDRMRYINHIYINMAWRRQYAGVFEMEYNGSIIYFVDNEFYFAGDKPYDYIHLDCEKFIFFSKAVLSLLPTIGFRPDVINCNDWQTGPIPVFLDTFQDNPFYRGIKTVMTIHNLKFQGRWSLKGIKDAMGISDYYFTPDKMEYYKDANLLKGGMVYADKITTVSDTYAGEIQSPEYGEGLDALLRARNNDLLGIVNGISYTDWNPETDPMIYQNYTKESVYEKKVENKIKLQQELGLPVDPNKMMIGVVSRLTDQKGFDLVAYKMEELCNGGAQVVVLGTGDEKYENLFRHYAWKYPDRFSAQIYFSNEMSHKIYAACDAFLMPSRFEPCGLSQLISLRYGTLPIVRETGGLKDTVDPYNQYTGDGNGFSFANYNADEMLNTIWYAMDVYYNNREGWNHVIYNAMNSDFSWNVSADKYIRMYQELTGIYDLPVKKNETPAEKNEISEATKAEKDIFEETIERDFKASNDAVASIAKEPEIVEVANPFEEKASVKEEKPAKQAKKATAKKKEEAPSEEKKPVKRTRKTKAAKEEAESAAEEPKKSKTAQKTAKAVTEEPKKSETASKIKETQSVSAVKTEEKPKKTVTKAKTQKAEQEETKKTVKRARKTTSSTAKKSAATPAPKKN